MLSFSSCLFVVVMPLYRIHSTSTFNKYTFGVLYFPKSASNCLQIIFGIWGFRNSDILNLGCQNKINQFRSSYYIFLCSSYVGFDIMSAWVTVSVQVIFWLEKKLWLEPELFLDRPYLTTVWFWVEKHLWPVRAFSRPSISSIHSSIHIRFGESTALYI